MPDFHVTFRDLLHAVNVRHGTNGFISLPKEGVMRIFSPWKIRRLRPGLNPRNWVPKASTLPLDHRGRFGTKLKYRTYYNLCRRGYSGRSMKLITHAYRVSPFTVCRMLPSTIINLHTVVFKNKYKLIWHKSPIFVGGFEDVFLLTTQELQSFALYSPDTYSTYKRGHKM